MSQAQAHHVLTHAIRAQSALDRARRELEVARGEMIALGRAIEMQHPALALIDDAYKKTDTSHYQVSLLVRHVSKVPA